MLKHTFVALTLVLSITGCKKQEEAAKAAPAEPAPAPAAKPADPPAPVAKPVEAISLAAAGDSFKGFTVQGPAGAQVSSNGGDGVIINFPDNTLLQLTPADGFTAAEFKKSLALNAKTVTYSVDTAEDLTYVTETDMGGTLFKGYGFNVVVAAGGKKLSCGSTFDDQATADRLKAICKSFAKS